MSLPIKNDDDFNYILIHEAIHGLIANKFGYNKWQIYLEPFIHCKIWYRYTYKPKRFLCEFVHLIHDLITQIFRFDLVGIIYYIKTFLEEL